MVDGKTSVAGTVLRRSQAEPVGAVAANHNWPGQGRGGAGLADEVGGVFGGQFKVYRLDGAVVLAERVVLDVYVFVVFWVRSRAAVCWVGAVRSLGSGRREGSGEERGEGEELHLVCFGVASRAKGIDEV